MPTSQQFESIIGFVTSSFVITGVAVMMSRAMDATSRETKPRLLSRTVERHSIPWEAKQPLIEKYGLWAVNRAEALCPHNDVACVEREAKWSLEVYRQRREI